MEKRGGLKRSNSFEKQPGAAAQSRQNVKNRVEGIANDALQMPHPPIPNKPTATSVLEQFLDIPLLDTLNRINAQVGGLQKQLTKVDFQVATALNPPNADGDASQQPTSSEPLGAPSGTSAADDGNTFLTDVDVGASVPEAPASKPRNLLEGTRYARFLTLDDLGSSRAYYFLWTLC